MRLLAAGFNGHGQLSAIQGPTITAFTEVARGPPGEPIEVCWAGWSDVVLRIGVCYFWRGGQGSVVSLGHGNGTSSEPWLHSFFGTHDGCRGAVTNDSKPFLLSKSSDGTMSFVEEVLAPPITGTTNVAVTGTNKTIITVRNPSIVDRHVRMTDFWEFATIDEFLAFARLACLDSRRLHSSQPSFSILHAPGTPLKAIHAGQTFCVAHMSSALQSWGWDARHNSSLGRPTEECSSSTTPDHVVGFSTLDEVDIKKVATCQGGHLAAVLTEDGSVYIWGSCGPDYPLGQNMESENDGSSDEQPQQRLGIFTRAEADDWSPSDGPLPIEIDDLPDEDFIDVGVGAAHVVLVDRKRGVWVAGDNSEGQLGLSLGSENDSKFLPEFKKVHLGMDEKRVKIKGVKCGWYSTFLVVEDLDVQVS